MGKVLNYVKQTNYLTLSENFGVKNHNDAILRVKVLDVSHPLWGGSSSLPAFPHRLAKVARLSFSIRLPSFGSRTHTNIFSPPLSLHLLYLSNIVDGSARHWGSRNKNAIYFYTKIVGTYNKRSAKEKERKDAFR